MGLLRQNILKIGYDKHFILELSLRIRKGQKIGILGVNGSGKTTFLKTVAGFLPAVAGECALGNNITIGYFDQYSAAIQSEKTVVEHFSDLFPSLTDKEVRTILGAIFLKERTGQNGWMICPEVKKQGWCWQNCCKAGQTS